MSDDADIIAERQAVLLGYDAIAALRADKEQQVRLAAEARNADRRLATAIRKGSR